MYYHLVKAQHIKYIELWVKSEKEEIDEYDLDDDILQMFVTCSDDTIDKLYIPEDDLGNSEIEKTITEKEFERNIYPRSSAPYDPMLYDYDCGGFIDKAEELENIKAKKNEPLPYKEEVDE